VRTFLKSILAQNTLPTLLKYNVGACIIIFILLEIWRPHYFLTDDNLSQFFPILTEMGRHLKNGQSPFVSDYLFGGHYDWSRDPMCLLWHPFFLGPALLADTSAHLWMLDVIALLYLLLITVGFTVLAHTLRSEFKLQLSDIWLIFYTMSYVFSMYILMIGPSWINFLGNQSALPWLTLGIMDRKITRGVILVTLITVHQFVGSFAGMTLSNTILLTIFALGMAVCRRSPRPFFIWCAGNLLGLLLIAPFLLHVLDGFAHTVRLGGVSAGTDLEYAVPVSIFPQSFFLGNWTELLAALEGDKSLTSLTFPYVSSLLACAAAWCLVPALLASFQWRPIEILCLGMIGLTMLLVIRPPAIAEAIQHLPFLKSMRWPFREGMQFLFFIHLFIIIRPQMTGQLQRLIPLYSLILFVLPLPFIRPPTLNPLAQDRLGTLSDKGDQFWNQVKLILKPTDEIATVIDSRLWRVSALDIPYTYLGTANFPALYRIACISGYSTTSPIDRLPLKTLPSYWFGAFDATQLNTILQERPNLKILIIKHVRPLKIVLYSKDAPEIDLTPYLPR
jgi:hypothetical protein